MKCLCLALCLVTLVVVGFSGSDGCDDSDDCGDVGCCVRVGGHWFKMKKCKPYTREGKKCIPQGSKNGVYDFGCPCEEGLQCVGEVKVEPTSADVSSSESEEELVYRCRAEATPEPPEVSSAEPEQEHSEEPQVVSEEPEPEPEIS